MAENVLNVFANADLKLTMSMEVIDSLSRYCHTGSSWKNCLAPAQDISRYLIPGFVIPRLLPRPSNYQDQCDEIIKFIGKLGDSQPSGSESSATAPEDAVDIKVVENLVIERRILARSRNRDIAKQRKELDDHTCQACDLKLFVNGRFIVDCHHRRSLATDNLKQITTLDDLVTLCPTCHRVAHTRLVPLDLDEIRKAIGR